MEKSEFDEPESAFDLAEDTEVLGVLESVFDKPLVPVEKRKIQRAAEHKLLAADIRELTLRQRLFVRAMLSCQMRPAAAIREVNKTAMRGGQLSQTSVSRWMRDLKFKSIIERCMQVLIDTTGVANPSQTLLRIDAIVEDALMPVPMYHNGLALRDPEGNVQKEVDRGSALKGLELLGKAAGVFRKDEENSQRVTVVLDFSGDAPAGEQESEIIEGDFAQVPE